MPLHHDVRRKRPTKAFLPQSAQQPCLPKPQPITQQPHPQSSTQSASHSSSSSRYFPLYSTLSGRSHSPSSSHLLSSRPRTPPINTTTAQSLTRCPGHNRHSAYRLEREGVIWSQTRFWKRSPRSRNTRSACWICLCSIRVVRWVWMRIGMRMSGPIWVMRWTGLRRKVCHFASYLEKIGNRKDALRGKSNMLEGGVAMRRGTTLGYHCGKWGRYMVS